MDQHERLDFLLGIMVLLLAKAIFTYSAQNDRFKVVGGIKIDTWEVLGEP